MFQKERQCPFWKVAYLLTYLALTTLIFDFGLHQHLLIGIWPFQHRYGFAGAPSKRKALLSLHSRGFLISGSAFMFGLIGKSLLKRTPPRALHSNLKAFMPRRHVKAQEV